MNLKEGSLILKDRIIELEKELEKYKKESRVDFLTDLENRRAHDLKLDELKHDISRLERKKKDVKDFFYYIMIDLDNFKHINDNWGHDAGDRVLKSVSKTLKDNMRNNESIFRFGGDEFVILIKNIKKDELLKFLKRLHNSIRNLCYGNIKVDASFGVAGYNSDIEKTIKRADQAMYLSKKSDEKITFFGEKEKWNFYNHAFENSWTYFIEKIQNLFRKK